MSDASAPLSKANASEALNETLELLATIAASLSDRVDAQTAKLEKLERTAAETRAAAFATQKATDPEVPLRMIAGALASEQVHLSEATLQLQTNSNRVYRIGELLKEQSNSDRDQSKGFLKELQNSFEVLKAQVGSQLKVQETQHLKIRKSWQTYAIFFALLWLVLLANVPRELLRSEWGCGFLGGQWHQDFSVPDYCSVR